jgi:hypothetical protein
VLHLFAVIIGTVSHQHEFAIDHQVFNVIQSKAWLPDGTQIRNVASIVFDGQPAITTNQVDPHDPSKGTDPEKEALVTISTGPLPIVITGTATGITSGSATIRPGRISRRSSSAM